MYTSASPRLPNAAPHTVAFGGGLSSSWLFGEQVAFSGDAVRFLAAAMQEFLKIGLPGRGIFHGRTPEQRPLQSCLPGYP